MKKNMKEKNLLNSLGERYTVIEHDGGYCMYDKQRPAKRSNYKYIGKFYVSSDKNRFAFNDKYYEDVESMVKAMDEYSSTLPFDIDIYNPLFKNSYRIECALHDYLSSLGFAMEYGCGSRRERRFVLNDCYGQCICDLTVHVEEDTTMGIITRNILTPDTDNLHTTESRFMDLDSAIASVNTILAPYVASVGAVTMNVLNKITNSRSAILLDTTFIVSKLSKYTEDGMAKMIEVLEKELEQLKGMSKGETK